MQREHIESLENLKKIEENPELREVPEEEEKDKDFENLEEGYEHIADMKNMANTLRQEVINSNKVLEQIKESLDLSERAETASEKDLKNIQENIALENKKIEEIEEKYLDIPEGEVGEKMKAPHNSKFIPENETKNLEEMKEEIEEMEKEMVEARRKSLEEWEKSTIESLSEGDLFNRAENGERAKKLLTLKIKFAIDNSSEVKQYIEKGGFVHFKISSNIMSATINRKQEGSKEYITDLEVEFNSHEENNKDDQEKLVDKKEEKDIHNAELEGNLKEKSISERE